MRNNFSEFDFTDLPQSRRYAPIEMPGGNKNDDYFFTIEFGQRLELLAAYINCEIALYWRAKPIRKTGGVNVRIAS